MQLSDRKIAFLKLGHFIKKFVEKQALNNKQKQCDSVFSKDLTTQVELAAHLNGWFTEDNVYYALETWSKTITQKNIEQWTKSYDFSDRQTKTVGIVTAGNIPLVGFHDFISVLMSGHKLLVKQSSNDQKILPVLADYLICIEPRFKHFISFTEGRLQDFDAVIATGSNNTARYFEHYFKKRPSIIRKNRNAVAVLTGMETEAELALLSEDIFRYFGLGCRSVSKVFVPKDYDFDLLFKGVFKQGDLLSYRKYKNNYDYNKTVYLMSQIPLLENGFLVLKEDTAYASPIATLFYEYYDSIDSLDERLVIDKEQIQCVVRKNPKADEVVFGETQQPQLWDYADGVDTMKFLLGL